MTTELLGDPNFGVNLLAIGGLIGSIAAAAISIATFVRQGTQAKLSKANAVKLDEVHVATNGMAEKLGAAREAKGDAEGYGRAQQEKADER